MSELRQQHARERRLRQEQSEAKELAMRLQQKTRVPSKGLTPGSGGAVTVGGAPAPANTTAGVPQVSQGQNIRYSDVLKELWVRAFRSILLGATRNTFAVKGFLSVDSIHSHPG